MSGPWDHLKDRPGRLFEKPAKAKIPYVPQALLDQYLGTILWAETDHDEYDEYEDVPLERHYDIENFTKEAVDQAKRDIASFLEQAGDMVDERGEEKAMHDFWLTRSEHGAGFWDGDWPRYGDRLTEIAKRFPLVWVYVTDDGEVDFG